MIKKDKLFLLIFIFSINSILASIILKLLGLNIFNVPNYNLGYPMFWSVIKLLILITQYYLIVGCVTRLPPKELFIKIIPYFPLTILLYYLPEGQYSLLNPIILFVTCLTLIPKFSTILNFVINAIFIMSFQLIIIWLRLDIRSIAPVFPDSFQFAIMNIDQLIILSFLYFVNRKRGDLHGMVFSRSKK